ncbi:MAG TPA: hypothetical protein VJ439_00485 [Candidatus Bathyarchaeia archaeon]|nr:hypothetical protein [Candidatus Bathyarchaeia archaeon]
MSKEENVIQLEKLSPRALETLRELAKTTGHDNYERTVEELAFAMRELLQIIDTQRDPLLEPEATSRQMEIMRGVLQRFKRFEK